MTKPLECKQLRKELRQIQSLLAATPPPASLSGLLAHSLFCLTACPRATPHTSHRRVQSSQPQQNNGVISPRRLSGNRSSHRLLRGCRVAFKSEKAHVNVEHLHSESFLAKPIRVLLVLTKAGSSCCKRPLKKLQEETKTKKR